MIASPRKSPLLRRTDAPMPASLIMTGPLATECLLQGVSKGLVMAWDGKNEKVFLVRALGNRKAFVGLGPRSDILDLLRGLEANAETALGAAYLRDVIRTVAAGAPDGRVHVLIESGGDFALVDIATQELAEGRMNRVMGKQEVTDLVDRCTTQQGASSLVGEAVARMPRCSELAHVHELVSTEWDRPSLVAATIPPALAKLDPPLRTPAERRIRLSLLALDQVLRDRQAASVALASGQLS
jgi:hypothetical protein